MNCIFCRSIPGTIDLRGTKHKLCEKCFELLKNTIRQELGEMAPPCDAGMLEIVLKFAKDKGLLNDSAQN